MSSSIMSFLNSPGKYGMIPFRELGQGKPSRMDEEEHIDASASATEPVGYPGGPYDPSLLVKYEHHIARHIWFGEERSSKKELKVAGHGLKLIHRVPLQLPREIEGWISRSGLASLQRTSLTKIDTNLVSAMNLNPQLPFDTTLTTSSIYDLM
ncbi:unnamed protein product [Lathyrus sativus]|nr:unnamed protein product [Lathyrus sativus]